MPTGYTEKVQSGKITTLRQFALKCATAFIYDSSEVPKEFPQETYHFEHLKSAVKEFNDFMKLTDKEIKRRAKHEYRQEMKQHKEYLARKKIEKQRYQDMLKKVRAWKPVKELKPLKTLMLNQLQDSIKHDCSANKFVVKPTELSPDEWYEQKREKFVKQIKFYEEETEKETIRNKEENEWLSVFWSNLPK